MAKQASRSAADLGSLEEQHEIKRIETLKALEALGKAKHHALLQLQKTQILFKYLNWKQQEHIKRLNDGSLSLQKIYSVSASAFNNPAAAADSAIAEFTQHTLSLPGAASFLQKVKTVRKNIVQFGILEERANELIRAIVKSTVVFNHQYQAAYRELFPLGFFSKARRYIGQLFHHPFFSWQEMGCLQNLGKAAGFVLKMAETPVLGVR